MNPTESSGSVRSGPQQAAVLAPKALWAVAVDDAQDADDLVPQDEGDAQHRAQRVSQVVVADHVRFLQRLVRHPVDDLIVGRHAKDVVVGRGPQFQPVLGLVVEHDKAHLGLDDGPQLLEHGVEHVVEGEVLIADAVHPVYGLQLLVALLKVIVRVSLDDGRVDLALGGFEQRHVVWAKRGLGAGQQQRAQPFVRAHDDGDGHQLETIRQVSQVGLGEHVAPFPDEDLVGVDRPFRQFAGDDLLQRTGSLAPVGEGL
jgi:hypothetical protein